MKGKDYCLLEALEYLVGHHAYEKIMDAINEIEKKSMISDDKYNSLIRSCYDVLDYYNVCSDSFETNDYFQVILTNALKQYGYMLSKLKWHQIRNLVEFIATASVFNLDENKINIYISYVLTLANSNSFNPPQGYFQILCEDFNTVEDLTIQKIIEYISFFEKTSYGQISSSVYKRFDINNSIDYRLLHYFIVLKMEAINKLEVIFTEEDFEKAEVIPRLELLIMDHEKIKDMFGHLAFYNEGEKISDVMKDFINEVYDYVKKIDSPCKCKILKFEKKNTTTN